MITKYGVLKRKNPLRAGLMMIPVYFGFTAAVLTLVIVWKGAASLDLDDWTAGQILGCTFGVAGGVVVLYAIFLLPFLHRRLVMEDWTLKSWEVIKGPLLWKRGPVPEVPEGVKAQIVQDYYRGHGNPHTNPILANEIAADQTDAQADLEKTNNGVTAASGSSSSTSSADRVEAGPTATPQISQFEAFREKCYQHPAKSVKGVLGRLRFFFFRGVERDVVAEQTGIDGKPKGFAASFLAKDLSKMHEHVPHYDNKTEHLYSFLQVMTAATASFAHGANDVSNAIGPLAAIYLIWQSGETSSKSPVPIWILVFGGAAISIGLWTYGYNLMINLGNRLTLHSPSRGFSMELGAALTVILATRLGLPISTTQCITGATVGVGLCSGTYKAINWRMIAWIYMGWIITLPVAGIISGGLMGIILNAPRWGLQPNEI